jgi:hypothetical protein
MFEESKKDKRMIEPKSNDMFTQETDEVVEVVSDNEEDIEVGVFDMGSSRV